MEVEIIAQNIVDKSHLDPKLWIKYGLFGFFQFGFYDQVNEQLSAATDGQSGKQVLAV